MRNTCLFLACLFPTSYAFHSFSKFVPNSISPTKYQQYELIQQYNKKHIHSLSATELKDREVVIESSIEKTNEEKEQWKARAILLTVSAFYGTNFASVKILNDNIDPSIAALCRFTIAAMVFLPHVIKTIKTNPTLILGGLEVGLYSALGYWAQSNALETTGASIVAFICSLAVIVVPLLDKFVGNKKSEGVWYNDFIAPMLATIGVGCLELGGSELPGIGSLWALLQPLFFGLGFWRIERLMREAKLAGEAQAFTGAMMLVVAVFSLVWTSNSFIAPLMGDPTAISATIATQMQGFMHWQVIVAILWTGVVTTALTSFGENIAMKKLSAAESTVIYSTEPLWGTAFAAVALGEHIGVETMVGAGLILSACLWSSLGPALPSIGLATQEAVYGGLTDVSENMAENWFELLKRWTSEQ
jgi:drug/metabolite transporter (DMT)-like permease